MRRACKLLITALLAIVPPLCRAQSKTPVQPVGNMAVVGDSSTVVVQLNNATVSAHVEPVKIVEDTVEYNPAAYRLPEDAMLEDLLRKIPGLEINDGTVTLHGRQVTQILIDGKRFFSGNVKTGLQNISAEMVAKVRAYERESDFTRTTGIDDGEQEPVLDLKIKKHMMDGWRGNVSGAYGLENRYNARANANKIKKDEQNTLLANFNNLNGKININNASRNQLGGGGSGDSDKMEGGFNMSRKGKKVDFDANVHYNGNDRKVVSQSNSETVYSTGITSYTGTNSSRNRQYVPTADTRVEWNLDKNNLMIFKANFKYTGNRNLSHTLGTNYNISGGKSSDTDNGSLYKSDIFSSTFTYQYTHRFNQFKRGRSLTFNAYWYNYSSDEYNPLTYKTLYTKSQNVRKVYAAPLSRNTNTYVQLSYNEPIRKGYNIQSYVQFFYAFKDYARSVYDINAADPGWEVDKPLPSDFKEHIIPSISAAGHYEQFMTKITLNMRLYRKKFNITAGFVVTPQISNLSYKDTLGRDTVVRKTMCYFAPNFTFNYRPTKTEKLTIFYRTWTGSPSVYNLLPVSNGTNPLYVHYGNENLLVPFTHKMDVTFNKSNLRKQSSLVCNMTFRYVQNQISNRTEYNPSTGGTTAVPFNIEGNWDADGSMAYTKTLERGFSVVQHASANFVNNMSYLYDSRTKSTDINKMQRLMLKESFDATYRNDYLELIANVNGDFTMENSALRPEMTQYPFSFGAGLKANALCPWDMRVVADFSFLGQRGYIIGELNRNYYVLNASISQPFYHKRFVVSIEGYDLLGQLPNLTRNFNASSRSIVTFNGVNRTVMLKLLYRFKIGK